MSAGNEFPAGMSITIENDIATIEEATAILLEKMSPAKVARLLANLRVGAGDYVKTRERLFVGETVAAMFDKASGLETDSAILREEPPKP